MQRQKIVSEVTLPPLHKINPQNSIETIGSGFWLHLPPYQEKKNEKLACDVFPIDWLQCFWSTP